MIPEQKEGLLFSAQTYLQLPLWQSGPSNVYLLVLSLNGKHCQQPHCRNGVVDTFGQYMIWKYEKKWVQNCQCGRVKGAKKTYGPHPLWWPGSVLHWKGHWKICLHLQRLLQILILVKLDKSQKIFSIWSQLLFNKACMYKNHDKVQFYIIEKWWPHQFTVMEF